MNARLDVHVVWRFTVTSPRDAEPTWAACGPTLSIDALGKKCPLPIIMLAERIGEVAIGDVVEVLADDPATKTDVPAWCGLKSHKFLGATELAPAAGWAFLVRRTY
jgi:tRNA 2-thiouridine synthesizing protein A